MPKNEKNKFFRIIKYNMSNSLQMLGSILAPIFCMLTNLTQDLVKCSVFIVDEPKYTRNTSLYRVTDYVM